MSTLKVASIRDLSGIGGFTLASGNITANGTLTVSNLTINGTMSGSSGQIVPSVSGQSGKFLTTNGSSMSWTSVSSENIQSMQVWTGNGTWNRPSGVTYIHVRLNGGGGGGAGHGESGGAGGYSERVMSVANISSVGITIGGGDTGQVAGRGGGAVRAGRRLERRRGRALAGGAVEGVQHVQRAAVPHRQRVGERDPLGRHVTSEEGLKVLVVHVVEALVVHRVRAPREQEGEEREEPRQPEEDDHLAVREGVRPHRRPALAAPVVGGLPARAVEQEEGERHEREGDPRRGADVDELLHVLLELAAEVVAEELLLVARQVVLLEELVLEHLELRLAQQLLLRRPQRRARARAHRLEPAQRRPRAGAPQRGDRGGGRRTRRRHLDDARRPAVGRPSGPGRIRNLREEDVGAGSAARELLERAAPQPVQVVGLVLVGRRPAVGDHPEEVRDEADERREDEGHREHQHVRELEDEEDVVVHVDGQVDRDERRERDDAEQRALLEHLLLEHLADAAQGLLEVLDEELDHDRHDHQPEQHQPEEREVHHVAGFGVLRERRARELEQAAGAVAVAAAVRGGGVGPGRGRGGPGRVESGSSESGSSGEEPTATVELGRHGRAEGVVHAKAADDGRDGALRLHCAALSASRAHLRSAKKLVWRRRGVGARPGARRRGVNESSEAA